MLNNSSSVGDSNRPSSSCRCEHQKHWTEEILQVVLRLEVKVNAIRATLSACRCDDEMSVEESTVQQTSVLPEIRNYEQVSQ